MSRESRGIYMYIQDTCTMFAISFPIEEVFCSLRWSQTICLFCFKISSDGCLLTCGYHFKQRVVREGGEWITYDGKTPSAYDVVPMLILVGQRLNLAGLFTCKNW